MSLRRPIFPDALWRAAGVAAFCGLACLSAAPASAGYVMSGPQSKELLPLLSQRPMDVYVATGAPDSCGPGCSKWIAVEGKIDPGSGKRFREFLAAEPERRNLPVFFHSPGGVFADSIVIALSLRENNMTAGVGRTMQEGCTVLRVADSVCDTRVKSGEDVPSQLTFDTAQCHSACVYALAGAAQRKIDARSKIGIHAPLADERAWKKLADENPGIHRLSDEERHSNIWRFVMSLGVDPALVDLAGKISHNSLYILDRDEVLRFGLETGDRFETGWLLRTSPTGATRLVKSVTSGTNNGDERSTSIAQLDCSDLFGYRLTLYRPLPKEPSGMPGPARLEAGGIRLSLLPGATKAIAFWTTVARPDEIQNLAAQREIDISFVYPRGQETAVAIKMSTAGLLMGLDELQKYCSQRKVKPSAG